MKDSDYHVCLDCSLIFARRRQSLESVAQFYQWFALLERRGYAVYPPPTTYVQAKAGTARIHMKYLADYGVLSPGMTIAHLRCDVGSLLAQISEQYSGCTIHGYDYFDSNIRYARDQGLDSIKRLDLACMNLADNTAYDLIICNHIFTHAIDPTADLQMLYAALKPGGVLYLYGEVDHHLRFKFKGPYYQWRALNNYHKQLFAPSSLEYFLIKGGFSIEARDHRKFYMQFLARREVTTGDLTQHAAAAQAAKVAAPVMSNNFQRWVQLRDSPLHGFIKITRKLIMAPRPPS